MNFDDALRRTVKWYVDNEPWWRGIKERSAEFREYYAKQYGARAIALTAPASPHAPRFFPG